MMVERVFQAISSGINTAIAQVVLLTIYPKDKRGGIMGWYGLSLSAAPIVAPTIGGIFVDTVGWRMVFVVTLAFMTVGLFSSIFFFNDVMENRKDRFDIYSFVLSALAFGGVTIGLGNARKMNYLFFLPLIIGFISSVFSSKDRIPWLLHFWISLFLKPENSPSACCQVAYYICA